MKPLNKDEERVIAGKGTEAPFTGKYLNHKEPGVYVCRRCGSALYSSGDKFESGCGWPSFDAAIPGQVQSQPDPDGRRTEIVCAECGAHLGHVFVGEGYTAANTRHCVNSVSLDFMAAGCAQTALFAGGCFWGLEHAFSRVPGVLKVVSGYSGGQVENPSYEQVCTGRTGHAETIEITFDPALVSYEQLVHMFFNLHDPTQLDRQGPDVGPQYRSAIFYQNQEQKNVALKLIDELIKNGWEVVTELAAAGPFYPAEDYHQNFTRRTGRGACHTQVERFLQRA